MQNINFKGLENTNPQVIHSTFLKAFSDYQVQMNLTFSDFEVMMKRRGFMPTISMGAFTNLDNEPVGFILNGLRQWNGKLTAYDTGTGVIPSYRKQGITSNLFSNILTMLAQQKVEQYLLEVFQDNTAAVKLYQNQGFTVTRTFSIYQWDENVNQLDLEVDDIEIVPQITLGEWEILKEFWDFNPSWQNSIDSIRAVPEEFIYVVLRHGKKLLGYGIVSMVTGDVPQFAVRKEYRRQGIATRILVALLQNTKARSLHFINVDDSSQNTREFLYHIGCKNMGAQYEMILPLTKK